MKPSIYGLTFDQLTEACVSWGYSAFHARQIWDSLYIDRVKQIEDISVRAEVREAIAAEYVISTQDLFVKQEAGDGTVKFLLKLHDGHYIETVLMRHKYGRSVCVTTQVGCNIGCSFCASGLLKKTRDLTAGEVVEQIMTVQHYLDEVGEGARVSHIVVMGIGEPFDNFDNLVDFLRVVKDERGLAIAPRKINVSTSGLADKIYKFADLDLRINLALSLHAPNDALRTQIMKINRAFPLDKLMPAIRYYVEKTNKRITFEYILLSKVNDLPEHAEELAALIDDIKDKSYVNLIPYNPVNEHIQYERSTSEDIMAFYDVLKKRGINTGVRLEHGTDIDAACGQLRSKHMNVEGAK
ncbi:MULTISPECIES: 23S rRNA (adenine(2503)-C(2))-methyltransferase RlmN [Exiguobacterium]|jgi:23S rRNA (adenine2503-C2)-methyltransferase|uniref:23S rRNA (adenine(2503)-C(2))-methyltransferase RlmN n=1 Tax=Exiguobacterium TaxID=33986 RepID=UPI000513627B|nr:MULTISPECIES: 23S rRNA (adenine(2503)-C(2))-methyltransferase RlmN [unclassified Exiguobacterium]KGI85555.1 RNA methyltransferase [Exiguobacterium mexicanum]